MKTEIITNNFNIDIYGYSAEAINKDYSETARRLMDKMWQIVKSQNLKHKGVNIWVYEPNEKVFAGVELNDHPDYFTGMEHKIISLKKYAYYKHVGSYNSLKQAGQQMRNDIKERGFEPFLPYIEIYGHWTNEETKLETELLMSVK